MKRTASLLAIVFVTAIAPPIQAGEVGVIFGGSRRVTGSDEPAAGTTLASDAFSLSNSTIDLYYGFELDSSTLFKFRLGRIEGPVGFRQTELRGEEEIAVRRDVEGEVQYLSGVVEYRFSEPFGSTGLFGGVGLYRHEAAGFNSTTDHGFLVGVNADFPLTRRYGVILDAAYHFTRGDFTPRYFTLGAGLRMAFY